MAKHKQHFNIIDGSSIERDVYLNNRQSMLNAFREALAESSKFAIRAAFVSILQQEEFVNHISKSKHPFAKPAEERQVLQKMIVEAKTVYGNDYDGHYSNVSRERNEKD